MCVLWHALWSSATFLAIIASTDRIIHKLARFFEISLPQLISQLFTTFNLDLFETIYKNLITIYCNLFCGKINK